MYVRGLECPLCGRRFDGWADVLICDACSTPLQFTYEMDRLQDVFSMERVHARPHNVWRYRELLPIRDEGSIITLGEGWTPITRS